MLQIQNKTILLLLIFSFTSNLLCQVKGPASIWYFGDSAGLDFKTSPVSSLTNSQMNSLESSGIISDSTGKLLFYTNGITVWNKNHEIMQGGTNLEGSGNASQNALILNHPDNDSLYYILLTPYSYNYLQGMKYCVVNIKANNGNGEVIEKNVVLHPNSSEKVSAVYHANGRDIWITGHEWGNNNFYLYLLTRTGFNKCPIINSVGIEYKKSSVFTDGIFVNQGFIKYSPNNKYMAHVFTPTDPLNIFNELYRFDKRNGQLELITTIPINSLPWGVEFSSNSENLFIGQKDSPVLVLNIPTLQSKTIDSLILPYSVSFQLSNDSNIYFGIPDSSFLGSINGNDFDNIQVNKKALNLSRGKMQYGLPNIFIGYLTYHNPRIMYENRCDNQTFDFSVANASQVDKWIFSNQNLFVTLIETGLNPSVSFSDTGLWLVQCVLSSNDTITTTLFVEPLINKHFLGIDRIICSEFDSTVLIAPDDMLCYLWNDSSTSSTLTTIQTGSYFVKVTALDYCVYHDTIEIILDPYTMIEDDFLGVDTGWCYTESSSIILKAPDFMSSYFWNTGDTLQEQEVDGSGTYWVSAITPNQCELSDTITITVDTLMLGKDFLGYDLAWCENIDTVISLNAPQGNYQYLWNNSSTNSEILIDNSGEYWVVITSTNGLCVESDTIIAIIDTVPHKPIIIQQNDSILLITQYQNATYQWYLNNQLLPDNTDFIKLTQNGSYHMIVYNDKGCFSVSDPVTVDNVGLNSIGFNNTISVYPNPAGDYLFVEFKIPDIYTLALTDLTGKEIYTQKGMQYESTHNISVGHLSKGIYFVRFVNIHGTYVKKFVKE